MSLIWEKRIKHIDRRLKPTELRGLRLQLLKDDVRRKRGLPSLALPSEYVFAKMRHTMAAKYGIPLDDNVPSLAKLEWIRLRAKLLDRPRRQRAGALRRRRISVRNTRIHLAQRRRQWLIEAEKPE